MVVISCISNFSFHSLLLSFNFEFIARNNSSSFPCSLFVLKENFPLLKWKKAQGKLCGKPKKNFSFPLRLSLICHSLNRVFLVQANLVFIPKNGVGVNIKKTLQDETLVMALKSLVCHDLEHFCPSKVTGFKT